MLLAFEQPGFYGITMRAMRFPLDLLWISRHGVVVDVGMNAPAGTDGYRPSRASSYVLEIAAGEIQRLGLHIGDTLRF